MLKNFIFLILSKYDRRKISEKENERKVLIVRDELRITMSHLNGKFPIPSMHVWVARGHMCMYVKPVFWFYPPLRENFSTIVSLVLLLFCRARDDHKKLEKLKGRNVFCWLTMFLFELLICRISSVIKNLYGLHQQLRGWNNIFDTLMKFSR